MTRKPYYQNWEGSVAQQLDKERDAKLKLQNELALQQNMADNALRNQASAGKDTLQGQLQLQKNALYADTQKNNLANPMSNLSSSERYLETMKDLAQKNALSQGALITQEREQQLKAAQAAQAAGLGNYYNQNGEKEKAIAEMIPSLTENQRQNYLMGRPISPAAPAAPVPYAAPAVQPTSYVPQNEPIETYLPVQTDMRDVFAESLSDPEAAFTLTDQLDQLKRRERRPVRSSTWLDDYSRPNSTLGLYR